MNYIILALLFFLSGFFMKYSDDLYDVDHNIKFASIFGILCGLTSAIATCNYVGAVYIFIAIIIGNLIALKIDGIHHIISLIVFVLFCLIFQLPDFNLIILIVCILAALGDEIGHETISNVSNNTFLNIFFEYRFLMKLVVFLLGIFNVIDIGVFILFILFELAYLFAGEVFKRS